MHNFANLRKEILTLTNGSEGNSESETRQSHVAFIFPLGKQAKLRQKTIFFC